MTGHGVGVAVEVMVSW